MRVITKAALARMGNFSAPTIQKKCAEGGVFFDAVTPYGQVDILHSVVVEWLIKRGSIADASDLAIDEFLDLTIRQIVELNRDVSSLQGFIKVRKLLVEVEYREMQIRASREELISREFLAKVCFRLIKVTETKLLKMTKRLVEKIEIILAKQSCGGKEEAEEMLTEEVSKVLKSAKREVINNLKGMLPE